jgi:PKHD-type hydroxylase
MIKKRRPFYDFKKGRLLTTTIERVAYWHWEYLFTPEEVDMIEEICGQEDRFDARVGGQTNVDKSVRKSKVSFHNDQKLHDLIYPKMEIVNRYAGWNYEIAYAEDMQYTVYHGDNSHFQFHTDSGASKQDMVRKISCSIQLSDPSEYEGGDFMFLKQHWTGEDNIFTPVPIPDFTKRGSAIFFPSFTYHRVIPVTSGIRKSLVIWFSGPKWR